MKDSTVAILVLTAVRLYNPFSEVGPDGPDNLQYYCEPECSRLKKDKCHMAPDGYSCVPIQKKSWDCNYKVFSV
jgi:hypothetical protein